jgi:Zn2+/Cd2+-exporting ATPase
MLIISTPVSYVAGLATTAQKGILIKGGAYLESLGMVKHVCFDKTGTLTNGEFALLHLEEWVNPSDGGGDGDNCTKSRRTDVLQYLALMESRAAHPVAQAILTGTRNEGVSIPSDMKLQKHTIIAGEGIAGVINGLDVHVGNERLFERLGLLDKVPEQVLASVASWKQLGGTIGFMSIEGQGIVCAYCAADAVRPEAAMVVTKLKQRGIRVTMLTGDNEDAAQAIGKQLGLEGQDQIRSKLLPQDKLAFVEHLSEDTTHSGRSALFSLCAPSNVILFCGDGVNDAPAIAAANVGVAMGAGAALAMETADVTLLDSDLEKLFYSLDMGRRVIRKIWENIIFSISVKFLVLGFTLTGRTHLWAAIASDVGAMILVTLNSMMLMPVRRGSKFQTGSPLETMKSGDVEKGQGVKHSPSQSFDVAKGSCAKRCCGGSAPSKPQACTTGNKQDSCCSGNDNSKGVSCCSVPKPCCSGANSRPSEHVDEGGCCSKADADPCCGQGKSHSNEPATKESKHGGCCGGGSAHSDEHNKEFSF